MTVYTIKTRLALSGFGYESTHAFRQKLLNEMGIDHELIVLFPFSGAGYQQHIHRLGLNPNKTTILPNLFSDLSPDQHTIPLEEFLKTIPTDYEELVRRHDSIVYETSNGYVDVYFNPYTKMIVRVIEKDRELRGVADTVYTEGKYMTVGKDGYQFFMRDGSEAFRIKVLGEQILSCQLGQHALTRDELILTYLRRKVKKGDLILNDEIEHHSPLIEAFANEKGARYLSVVHGGFSYLQPRKIHESRPTHVLTAHPLLSQHLVEASERTGITKAGFIHPIAFTPSKSYPIGLHGKKAFVAGNFTENKRISTLIKAFKQLPDWTLDIYGGSQMEATQLKEELEPTDNIHFKGFVPTENIPRSEYAVILSASASEVWANSVMEGMAAGCMPVLANSLYQLKLINDELGLKGIEGVHSLVSLMKEISAMSDTEREEYSNKAKAYIQKYASFDEAKKAMQIVLDDI